MEQWLTSSSSTKTTVFWFRKAFAAFAAAVRMRARSLFAIAGRDIRTAGVRDFGFAVAPRINAAGRLGTMENGIECLLSDDPAAALAFAESLNSINTERRELESEMQQFG